MELLAAVTDFLKALVAFVPRRELVPITHRGVKFVNGRSFAWLLFPFVFWTIWWKEWKPYVVALGPGITWWWPLFSQVETMPVNRQVLKLEAHDVLTLDGKPVKFRGTISYTISSIMRAMVQTWEVESSIDDEAEAAFCSFISSKRLDELTGRPREEVNDELTKVVAEQMKVYGVRTVRAKLSSLATGIPVLLLGWSTPTYTSE